METVNIWELGSRINIRLKPEFLERINTKIKAQYKTKKAIHAELAKKHPVPFGTFKDRMKTSYKYFIDVEIILEVCTLLSISWEEMQRNVIAYKTRRGWNVITQPKLPVVLTPVFDMLVAHHIGDGCVIRPGNNRKNYFGYTQYCPEYRLAYLKKTESVFGKVNYAKDYVLHPSTRQIYLPVPCAEIFFKNYALNSESFKSETAVVPTPLWHKATEFKLAFLLGLIIDEGHIDSTLLLIRLKNTTLIKELGTLCQELGYAHTISEERRGFAVIYILSDGMSKLYKDYVTLLNTYPEVTLGWKGLKIEEFIKRQTKQKIYRPGNKEKIMQILRKEDLTVNELATRMNMTRQGARYLINELLAENKVKMKSIAKFGNYIYGTKVTSCS